MAADVGEADRPRVVDQHAEDAASAWQVPDRPPCVLVDAQRQEALQLTARRVDHPDRRVAGAGELAGDLEDAMQHGIDVELCDEAAADLQEPEQAFLAQAAAGGAVHPVDQRKPSAASRRGRTWFSTESPPNLRRMAPRACV